VRAREAVYLALDMNQLNQDVFNGKGTVATSLFPQGTEFYNSNISFPKPDPQKAQQLFDQLAAEGKPVKFTIIGTTGNQSWMVDLQTQLKKFKNVSVSVKPLDGATYGTTLYTGDFDLAVYGVLGQDPEPAVEGFRSTYPLPIASLNDPVIDAALDEGRTATDHAGRQAAYDKLQTELNKVYRIKWQFAGIMFAAEKSKVTGLSMYGQGSALTQAFGLTS
jgi:peptide/nickel transport system substrate-binding protein